VIRNTPFLVQIFFIYFGLPAAGIRLDPYYAALLAMVINVGAYTTEIIRAGIESIDKGQLEASFALGLKPWETFRYIILKPALRTIYPALTSQFIFLMLTSSVVSVISAGDLTAVGATIGSQTFASFEVYFVITVMYFIMSLGFSAAFSLIERLSFNYPSHRQTDPHVPDIWLGRSLVHHHGGALDTGAVGDCLHRRRAGRSAGGAVPDLALP